MPSTRSLAVAATFVGLANCQLGGSPKSCPANGQLSCHNTTAVQDLCCFNAPGGSLLQTQFWDANPATGPSDSWTVHGLWPDNCDGTYQQFCDPSREYTNISDILTSFNQDSLLDYMNQYWKDNGGDDESFWEHEWGKHGTCISTLDTSCYTNYKPQEEVVQFFNRTVNLFKSLPSYQWLADAGITPSTSKTYTEAEIQAALGKNRNGVTVYLGCADSNQLDEIWYFYNVRGNVQAGEFVPDNALTDSSCPSTGIKYLPKGSSGGGSPTSTPPSSTGPTSTPTSTGPAFSGKGHINVVTESGSQEGFLISAGKWYTASGTPATYTVTDAGNGFTMKTSKGPCAVASDDSFSCASGNSATQFSNNGNKLVFDGASQFYGQEPSGQTQGTLYTSSGHGTAVSLEWQSA